MSGPKGPLADIANTGNGIVQTLGNEDLTDWAATGLSVLGQEGAADNVQSFQAWEKSIKGGSQLLADVANGKDFGTAFKDNAGQIVEGGVDLAITNTSRSILRGIGVPDVVETFITDQVSDLGGGLAKNITNTLLGAHNDVVGGEGLKGWKAQKEAANEMISEGPKMEANSLKA